MPSKKESGKKSAALFISPKNITFKSSLIQNQNAETKVEESCTSTAFSAQTNEKSGAILKSTQDDKDSITHESTEPKKGEKFVM